LTDSWVEAFRWAEDAKRIARIARFALYR
jgi:hypothetical protein